MVVDRKRSKSVIVFDLGLASGLCPFFEARCVLQRTITLIELETIITRALFRKFTNDARAKFVLHKNVENEIAISRKEMFLKIANNRERISSRPPLSSTDLQKSRNIGALCIVLYLLYVRNNEITFWCCRLMQHFYRLP